MVVNVMLEPRALCAGGREERDVRPSDEMSDGGGRERLRSNVPTHKHSVAICYARAFVRN